MTGRCLWRAPCVIAVDWRVPCGSAFVQRLPCIIPVVWRVCNGERGASGGALGENFVALPLGGWKISSVESGAMPGLESGRPGEKSGVCAGAEWGTVSSAEWGVAPDVEWWTFLGLGLGTGTDS